jgi:serpin B
VIPAGFLSIIILCAWSSVAIVVTPSQSFFMKTPILIIALLAGCVSANPVQTGQGINTFGIELHRNLAAEGGNQVTSPWSIQSALAMTYAGAAGKTREEMATTLHFGGDEKALHHGIAEIAADLAELALKSRERIEDPDRKGGPNTALEITTANRLFGQAGYPFEQPFLDLAKDIYAAPLELMDFKTAQEPSRKKINEWVAGQTKDRVKDLIPEGLITEDTKLVLTNAIYLKAAWMHEFSNEPNAPFFLDGGEEIKVPGLVRQRHFRYLEVPDGVIVAVPYADGGLQFLILVPKEKDGLAEMEKSLTADHLRQVTTAQRRDIRLHFPKFKLEPDGVQLKRQLIAMGMPTAFDQPEKSADFSRMAPRNLATGEYLLISEVVHKAFVAVDEYGTEAAAATAVIMIAPTSAPVEVKEPLTIRADRPFAFAIQHIHSGTCLFLGRVVDPR